MAIEQKDDGNGFFTRRYTGKDIEDPDLIRDFKDVHEEENEIRMEHGGKNHPKNFKETGSLLFEPSPRGWLDGGRMVYARPWGDHSWEKVTGGWALAPTD